MLDCIVLGAGPAGLSAAVNLHQRGKTVQVLGSVPQGLAKAERIDNYLGLPGQSGAEMLDAFAAHAAALGIVPEEKKVANIMPFDGHLMLNVGGEIMECGAVVLACGAQRARPVPGERELQGVSLCATCDGMLYRNKDVVVWGTAADAPQEAAFLASIGCRVTYAAPARPAALAAEMPFVGGKLERIEGQNGQVTGVVVSGQTLACQGVFLLRPTIAPDALVPGLVMENGFVQVNRQMATSVPGVFAAGDMTGKPLQVAKAVGEGLVAGLSAAEYLDAQGREQG